MAAGGGGVTNMGVFPSLPSLLSPIFVPSGGFPWRIGLSKTKVASSLHGFINHVIGCVNIGSLVDLLVAA